MISNHSLAGAMAGVFSTLAFIILHDLTISDIWAMTPFMLIAGGLCGLLVGWSYSLVVETHTNGRWLFYNLLYVLMLFLLGGASVLIFEPTTSFASLMALNGPPDDLIGDAMPLTLVFTLVSAVAIALFYRRSWKNFGAILLTTSILVLLLGLNVSVIGLVSIPKGSLYLVAEFLGLIVFINVVFVLCFMALTQRSVASKKLGLGTES